MRVTVVVVALKVVREVTVIVLWMTKHTRATHNHSETWITPEYPPVTTYKVVFGDSTPPRGAGVVALKHVVHLGAPLPALPAPRLVALAARDVHA